MLPINNDMMRAIRRFDSAGRPMTREIAQEVALRATRLRTAQHLRVWVASRLPDLSGSDAMPYRPITDGLRAPIAAVWAGLTMFLR